MLWTRTMIYWKQYILLWFLCKKAVSHKDLALIIGAVRVSESFFFKIDISRNHFFGNILVEKKHKLLVVLVLPCGHIVCVRFTLSGHHSSKAESLNLSPLFAFCWNVTHCPMTKINLKIDMKQFTSVGLPTRGRRKSNGITKSNQLFKPACFWRKTNIWKVEEEQRKQTYPKSQSLTMPSFETRMFSGFTSRWIIWTLVL